MSWENKFLCWHFCQSRDKTASNESLYNNICSYIKSGVEIMGVGASGYWLFLSNGWFGRSWVESLESSVNRENRSHLPLVILAGLMEGEKKRREHSREKNPLAKWFLGKILTLLSSWQCFINEENFLNFVDYLYAGSSHPSIGEVYVQKKKKA